MDDPYTDRHPETCKGKSKERDISKKRQNQIWRMQQTEQSHRYKEPEKQTQTHI